MVSSKPAKSCKNSRQRHWPKARPKACLKAVDRQDDVFGVSIQYNRRLFTHVSVYVGIGWRDVNSNLSRQDYDSATVSAGVVIQY